MKHYPSLVGIFAATLLSTNLACFAQQQQRQSPLLAALDADGDMVLSAEELEAAAAALSKLDTNQDGTLTRAEFAPGRGTQASQPASPAGRSQAPQGKGGRLAPGQDQSGRIPGSF